MSEDEEPDWQSFESYKGSDEPNPIPRWFQPFFHWFMVILSFAFIFCVGAFIAFFLGYDRRFGGSASFALRETWEQMWMRMVAGGICAVGLVIYWRFKKKQ